VEGWGRAGCQVAAGRAVFFLKKQLFFEKKEKHYFYQKNGFFIPKKAASLGCWAWDSPPPEGGLPPGLVPAHPFTSVTGEEPRWSSSSPPGSSASMRMWPRLWQSSISTAWGRSFRMAARTSRWLCDGRRGKLHGRVGRKGRWARLGTTWEKPRFGLGVFVLRKPKKEDQKNKEIRRNPYPFINNPRL